MGNKYTSHDKTWCGVFGCFGGHLRGIQPKKEGF